MLERLKELSARWREIKEVEALTDRDLDDLGMSRAQIEAFARMPRDTADRMAHMAANFGITEDALKEDHALYLELLGTCGNCRDRATCALVLAKGDLARPSDCAFCPNATSFAGIAA